jgi:hypothetical protein
MKPIYASKCVLGLILWLVVASCTDHQEPGPDKLRVKSLTRILPDAPDVSIISILQYDLQGRLGSIETHQTPGGPGSPTETSTFQYDGDGKLSQMDRTLSGGGSERYVYTNDGWKVTKIKYTGGLNDFYDFVLNYDVTGSLLLSTKRSFSFTGVKFDQVNDLTFSNGNVSSVMSTSTLARNITTTSIVTTDFGYDDHTNPFYGVFLIPAPVRIATPSTGSFNHYTYYGGVDNLLHLSKNNPVSANIKGASQTLFNYTYNASGLPTSRQTLVKFTLEQPAVLQETLLYEYETY